MNVHLRLERLIFEQMLVQAAIESELARLLAGRTVTTDLRAEASLSAELKQVIPSRIVTIRSQAN